MITFLFCYGAIVLVANLVMLISAAGEYDLITPADVLNPIRIYKTHKVNIFGCIFLALLGHALWFPVAPFYWIYKLCTIGRS